MIIYDLLFCVCYFKEGVLSKYLAAAAVMLGVHHQV